MKKNTGSCHSWGNFRLVSVPNKQGGCSIADRTIFRLLSPHGCSSRWVTPPKMLSSISATADILEMSKDRAWLAKVTNKIGQHWQKRNARSKDRVGARLHQPGETQPSTV